ncbi:MAG: class II glutamine amidotransferase [Mariniblastus sp.]
MCQLMGMSANVPTDALFSFTGLVERAGRTDVHRDGWGISFYQGKGSQDFRGLNAGSDCEVAQFLKTQKIKSDIVVGHIRQANVGALTLENTHPFRRELWGRYFTFAHNGQIEGIFDQLTLGRFKPVGSTDSEHIFCWLLHEIEQAFPEPPVDPKPLYDLIYRHLGKLHAQGVCNVLLTDGSVLIAYCSNRLQWITRRAPFGSALLKDIELEVDFATETTVNDVVTVIATQALTTNETWQSFEPNEMMVFEQGELNYQVKATD